MNYPQRILTTLLRRVWVYSRRISDLLAPAPLEEGFEYRRLEFPKDLEEISGLRPDLSRRDIDSRLQQGCECHAVWHEGRIVHCGWSASGTVWISYLHRYLVLDPSAFYSFDIFTAKAFRRNRLSPARSFHQAYSFSQRGFKVGYSVVAFENKAGMRATEAAGYSVAGQISSIGPGALNIVSSTGEFDARLERSVPNFSDS